MDETGIRASGNKPPKILSKSEKKQVGVISSAERGKLMTVIRCCNAAGSLTPPFFIYGRKIMVGRLLDGAPPGSLGTYTDNGWINGPKFLDWLHHFVENTSPTPEKELILILDNNESHKYIEALEYARKNNVIFESLPPLTTHRMQPLDSCVYGPFKTYFEQEVSTFQRCHLGRIITQYDVASFVGKSYLKAASARNAVQGFKSSGIRPTNRHIFSDADFLPASLADRAEVIENTNDSPSQIQSTNAGRLSNNSNCSTSTSVFENMDLNCSQASRISLRRTNGETSYDPAVEDDPSCSTTTSDNSFQLVEEPLTPHVKPLDIRSLPKPTPNKTSRKRKPQRAEVLISSPFKNMQIEKEEKRKRLSNNAAVKNFFKNLPPTSKPGKTKKQKSSKKKL
ncbi:uncharacterized protein [Parasteatoda tepidariorum]|uniref:uncharacterized protein n=1 Tax=Parasteatoda tepidariorum TaxID=114398 RepID=UPI0039BD58CE